MEFAQNNVYGIDFDPRAVKVAKALNLIAGDGKTHVYRANSLDSSSWEEEVKGAFKSFLRRFPKSREEDESNQKSFKYFKFDVVLSNPPFAGEVTERHILKEYKLAQKNDKILTKIERDTLFLEKDMNFLKDGGRMAIVLPQGVFNNANDSWIRDFIMARARILAVVSLGVNTFKPHTGTKTSILFIQKWDDKLCHQQIDYPIFFAVSKKIGKDNSGEYVFLRNKDGEVELDSHGHPKVDHDLDDVSDAFIEFAKKEKLSFWQ